MSTGFYRASFTLPADLALRLSEVSKGLSASQSLVLSVLLEEYLPLLALGIGSLGPDAVLGVARRANGQHQDVVRGLIADVLERGRAEDAQGRLGL